MWVDMEIGQRHGEKQGEVEKWPEPNSEGLCEVILWILDFKWKALEGATAGF